MFPNGLVLRQHQPSRYNVHSGGTADYGLYRPSFSSDIPSLQMSQMSSSARVMNRRRLRPLASRRSQSMRCGTGADQFYSPLEEMWNNILVNWFEFRIKILPAACNLDPNVSSRSLDPKLVGEFRRHGCRKILSVWSGTCWKLGIIY